MAASIALPPAFKVSIAAVVYGFVAGNDVMLLLGVVGFGAIVVGYGLAALVNREPDDAAGGGDEDSEPPSNHW